MVDSFEYLWNGTSSTPRDSFLRRRSTPHQPVSPGLAVRDGPGYADGRADYDRVLLPPHARRDGRHPSRHGRIPPIRLRERRSRIRARRFFGVELPDSRTVGGYDAIEFAKPYQHVVQVLYRTALRL